jgi:hypothetical protein
MLSTTHILVCSRAIADFGGATNRDLAPPLGHITLTSTFITVKFSTITNDIIPLYHGH